METQIEQTTPDKAIIAEIAESLAGEIATKMYNKLKLMKYLPEIKAIEAGKLKSLRGKDVQKFLADLT